MQTHRQFFLSFSICHILSFVVLSSKSKRNFWHI